MARSTKQNGMARDVNTNKFETLRKSCPTVHVIPDGPDGAPRSATINAQSWLASGTLGPKNSKYLPGVRGDWVYYSIRK